MHARVRILSRVSPGSAQSEVIQKRAALATTQYWVCERIFQCMCFRKLAKILLECAIRARSDRFVLFLFGWLSDNAFNFLLVSLRNLPVAHVRIQSTRRVRDSDKAQSHVTTVQDLVVSYTQQTPLLCPHVVSEYP
jgi:hypothetical protein